MGFRKKVIRWKGGDKIEKLPRKKFLLTLRRKVDWKGHGGIYYYRYKNIIGLPESRTFPNLSISMNKQSRL